MIDGAIATPRVRLRDLFTSFLKIGMFTIGGGYAMVPLIEREVVTRRGWVEGHDFLDLLTLAQSIPGPIALNSASFVGYKTRGYIGAFTSLMGIVLPSFTIILLVALFFTTIRDNAVVEAAFRALRPVVIALILSPMLSFMRGMTWITTSVVVATTALIFFLDLSPAILLLVAALSAIAWTLYMTKKR